MVLILAAGTRPGLRRHDREARTRAAPDADAQELPAERAGLPGAAAGQRQAPLFVWLPTGSYQHPFFYYYRDVDWGMHDEWSDQGLVAALDREDSLMAVLMPLRDYEQFLARTGRTRTMVPTRDLSTAIMLLPGPMSGCGLR